MKIKNYECKCGHNDFFFADQGNQTGIYCSYCGKWFKWVNKNERNLILKQTSTLDKIKAEIDKAFEDLDGYASDELTTFLCRIENIFYKYKAESDVKE